MKNLENLSVQEMNIKETQNTNGGIFGLDDWAIGVAVGGTVAAVAEIIGDWEHFKKGFFS